MKQLVAITILLGIPAYAQEPEPEVVTFKLSAASAAESNALRLLPASTDLEDGNASVVMLRMIWEKTGWMQEFWPKLGEVSELPHDDPAVEEFPFDSFQRQLRRAGRMNRADWEYPLNSEPLAMILLPDVQGLRNLAGRGMKIWIGQQIAKGDLHSAREGILTQLACARHMARTPIIVNHLVAAAVGKMGLDRTELLVQQVDSPNLYWALSGLPNTLGPIDEAIALESQMLVRSLPSLSDEVPPTGDPRWKQAAAEFSEFMSLSMGQQLTPADAAALKKRMVEMSVTELKAKLKFTHQQLAKMSEEEQVMRWIMAITERINTRIENAFTLPPPQALKMLVQLEDEILTIEKNVAAPASPFMKPMNVFLALNGFGRRVKLLQTLEAVRDHMAHHEGRLPQSLGDLDLPVPHDPFTGKPFEYRMSKNTATLTMARIEGIPVQRQRRRKYVISAASR